MLSKYHNWNISLIAIIRFAKSKVMSENKWRFEHYPKMSANKSSSSQKMTHWLPVYGDLSLRLFPLSFLPTVQVIICIILHLRVLQNYRHSCRRCQNNYKLPKKTLPYLERNVEIAENATAIVLLLKCLSRGPTCCWYWYRVRCIRTLKHVLEEQA